MNELLKQLQELNRKAFIFVKRQEYKFKAYFYSKKINKEIEEYRKFSIDCAPVFEELRTTSAPEYRDLNIYLRDNFDEEYPKYIELFNHIDNEIYLYELIYSEKELKGTYRGHNIFNFFNLEGKPFTYACVQMDVEKYSRIKQGLVDHMCQTYDLNSNHYGHRVVASSFCSKFN